MRVSPLATVVAEAPLEVDSLALVSALPELVAAPLFPPMREATSAPPPMPPRSAQTRQAAIHLTMGLTGFLGFLTFFGFSCAGGGVTGGV